MIVDHHDDLGTFLRQTSPEIANSPFVKEASWQEKPSMMDRDFALILVEPNGTEHRKLAMSDAGNTLASLVYLLTSEHNLPDSAVKLASYNLLNSAMHYGLYDAYGDSLLYSEKLGSAFDVLAMLADELPSTGTIDERRVSIKEAMGPGMSYSQDGSTIATTKPQMAPTGKATTVQTTSPIPPQQAGNTIMKIASYDLIKEAEFMWPELDPVDRRAFALIIKEAALEEGAKVPTKIAQYAGEELNPNFDLIMRRRLDYVRDPELASDYDRFSKVAYAMPLDIATETLYLLDEQAGLLDRYSANLPDPVLSIYGCNTKEAMWSWNHGGDYCTADELDLLVRDPVKRAKLEFVFVEDLVERFSKNPVATFESMPLEQQIILARMANSTSM